MTPRVPILLVNGDGVMALCVDTGVVQELQQRVTVLRLFGFYHIQMVDVIEARSLEGQRDILAASQTFAVTRGPCPPLLAFPLFWRSFPVGPLLQR